MCCDCSDQLQPEGVPGEMPKKSQKGRLGPVGPECQKSAEKSKKCRESAEERLLRDFSDFFGTFLALRGDRPETTFLRFFWYFGPGTPCCNWSLQSQCLWETKSASPKPHPSKPHPCNMPQAKTEKLRCSFWNAALQKLHCNIRFSAVRTSFAPKAALQQAKTCTATSKSLRCRKVGETQKGLYLKGLLSKHRSIATRTCK